MRNVIAERISAKSDEDIVIFLIGMRINKIWKPHRWIPPFWSMLVMLRKLKRLPREKTGCLGVNLATPGLTVIYWRSFEHLEAFSRAEPHRSSWMKFNKSVKRSRKDVGIWHETYLVPAYHYESLYSGMPSHGLGKAVGTVPAELNMRTARGRLSLQ